MTSQLENSNLPSTSPDSRPREDSSNSAYYSSVVGQVFRISDTTFGGDKDGFLVRFRGNLLIDSETAYDQLSGALKPQDITPLFRIVDGVETIFLVKGVVRPKPSNPWVNAALFALTLVSVLFAGAIYNYQGPESSDLWTNVKNIFLNLQSGWPFAISMLAILGAHEFGHYLVARYHGTAVTLPYFIPFPFSPFGTMGAFIQMKELPKNRRHLLDIGIAGPLAGLIVAIPVLIYGLATSKIDTLPMQLPPGQAFEGNSILYLLLKHLVLGEWLPKPIDFGNLSPFVYWVRYFFTGNPLPRGGLDVTVNSVAWAGWAGLLVTALNLIPAGQLDGGHLVYVILGKRATKLVPFILGILIVLGFFWPTWLIWALLIFIFSRRQAEPLDQITQLDQPRKILAVIGIIVFVLVFTPVPLVGTF